MADDQPDVKKPPSWLPLELLGAEDVRLIYVDAVWVNHTADDISVAFFQTKRPVLTQDELVKLERLPAACVGRIVLPVRVAEHLRDVLVELIAEFQATKKQI
jgi:hypothetical protein